MSDIVERLRRHTQGPIPGETCEGECYRCEAADEIKRLREEVEDLRGELLEVNTLSHD